jgi:hypothetical protein
VDFIFEIWKQLTQPQVNLLTSVIGSIIVPIAGVLWAKTSFKQLDKALAETQRESREAKNSAESQATELEAEQPENLANWRRLYKSWGLISNKLISISTDSNVDASARAKYGKIPNRDGYRALIEALDADKLMKDKSSFVAASDIWRKYRTVSTAKRAEIQEAEAAQMEALAKTLGLSQP